MLRAIFLFVYAQAVFVVSSACAANLVYPLVLSTGWNLAGNSLTTPLDVKAMFGTQASVTSVWKWNSATTSWGFYAPSLDAKGTLGSYAASKGYAVLDRINPGEGYWVNAAAPLMLGAQSGTGFSLTAANLSTGWNLVATGDDPTPAAFSSSVGGINTLWAWDAASTRWYFYAPVLAANGTLSSYIAGKGYEDFGAMTLGNGVGFWVNVIGAAADTTAPTVSATGPAVNATGVPINTKTIFATFTKAMDPTTLTPASFTLACPAGAPVTGTVTYLAAGNVATLTLPAAPDLPPSTVCTATITTGAKDATGIPLAGNFVWTFTSVVNAGNAPVANAGVPATYNGGETAALDGTGSSAPDGHSIVEYFWTQVSGTPVSLSNPRAAKPLFAVPNVNDTLTFRLIVSDGKAQSVASTVAITCLSYAGSAVVLQGNPFGESLDLPDSAMDVTLSGNYAYVADSSAGLKIIDISNPVKPSLVGTYDTPGIALRVKLSGNYAYVADHTGGVQIINVSDPAAPVLSGTYATSGSVTDVAVSGSRAFVAGDGYPASINGFLDIVDVSNPAAPLRLGRYESYGSKLAVAVSGNFAYLTGYGLDVIDISNPTSPSLVGSFASGLTSDLVVLGNRVFMADYDLGLGIIDVSNPAAPSIVGSFNTPGPWGMQAFGISIAGSYAYLAGLNGLHVINISNPAAPVLEGTYKIAHLSAYRGVAVAGQYAYLADDQGHRFQIIDVSHPSFSSVISSVATPGIANALAMSGRQVFVAEWANGSAVFNGMEIFDVSGPAAPSLAARYATPYGPQRLALAGNYAYLVPLYYGGIYVVDVSDVRSPTLALTLAGIPPADVDVVGKYLYTIEWSDQTQPFPLRILDVSNLANPTLVGRYQKIGGFSDITVVGGLAYIIDSYYNRLEIVDVSNPAAPFLVGSLNTIGGATQITVAGRYLYLSGWGIQIIDVSNPSNPTVIGNFTIPDTATGIVVAGNYAYVPNRFYGTKILDISDPSAPFLAGRYDVPITANSAVVDADNIYITAGENGFAVAERAPRLNTRYVERTAGSAIGYTVGWRDTEIPANVQVRCQVTGGTCAVTGIDQIGNTASVQWSLPSTPGHYEILFTVGNWQHFVTTKDRVIAR